LNRSALRFQFLARNEFAVFKLRRPLQRRIGTEVPHPAQIRLTELGFRRVVLFLLWRIGRVRRQHDHR
jgi:hypothetical protein